MVIIYFLAIACFLIGAYLFKLKRDLSVTLGKMTLKQQRNWLNKELDRRAAMNRKGEAAPGDLTIVMKYRIEVEKKLGLR